MISATLANKKKALEDITVFAELINYQGGWSKFATIHKKLAGFVTAPQVAKVCLRGKSYNKRRLILMPRSHLKSTVCSVLYVLWRIYRNPNIRILVGTNIKSLSQGFIREIRQYLEDTELGERVWNKRPHIEGRLIPIMDAAGRKRRSQKALEEETDTEDKKLLWTLDAIQVLRSAKLKEPTVYATSAGTRVTGQHYDLLILDDIVDFENSSTADKIDKIVDWAGDMESVVDPVRNVLCGSWSGKFGKPEELWEDVGDEVVVLGTRYTEGDYYDYLMCNMLHFGYRVFYRNIYRNAQNWVKPCKTEDEYRQDRRKYKLGDASGGFLWEDKFDAEYMVRLKARLTAKRWASQYLNTIIAPEETVLDPAKIKYFKSGLVEAKDGLVYIKVPEEEAKRVIRPFLTVDPAVSQNTRADNTAIAVGGIDEEGDMFIIDMKVGRFLPNQTVDHVFSLLEKWSATKVVIEVVGFQQALVFQMRDQMRERKVFPFIIEHNPQGKGEKKARLEAGLQPYFENRKLWMADWLATYEQLQDDIALFPRETAKDDTLDALDLVRCYGVRVPRDSRKLYSPTRTAYNKKWGGTR
jgi:predicted phage terminase large subunit-like protein